MEKEVLLESDSDEVAGGLYVLMLTPDQFEAIDRAGYVKSGKISEDDIPDIQSFLKANGYSDILNIKCVN